MNKTKIETFDSTWNVISGCLHSCEYCYARDIAHRFGGGKKLKYGTRTVLNEPVIIDGKKAAYPYGFTPTFHRYRLNDYIGKKGRNIFVCSMADLFGDWVPDEWIKEVFATCEKAPQHNYLFLTKNPKRYMQLANSEVGLPMRSNMWFGSSATNPKMPFYWGKGVNTFLSIEPILEPFGGMENIAENEIPNWIIVGAETGRRKDKVVPERKWIEDIVSECRKSDIPVFMKSSLADIWGEPLIQEFPEGLKRKD